jgi:hypothetical protein
MGVFGEVKGNTHASGHLDIQFLIEPETIRIRQQVPFMLNVFSSRHSLKNGPPDKMLTRWSNSSTEALDRIRSC